MNGHIDRRARRSRKALHEALMRLVLRTDYDSLTVQHILDEADVGRSTFYAHFSSKDDLLRSGFEDFRGDLMGAHGADSARPGERVSLALFAHVGEALPVYRALIGGRGAALADDAFRKMVADLLGSLMIRTALTDNLPPGLRLRFAVDTFLCVLGWGMDQKDYPDPELLDAHFLRLLGAGLNAGAAENPA